MGASIAGLMGSFVLALAGAWVSAWWMPVLRRRAVTLRVALGDTDQEQVRPCIDWALCLGGVSGLLCGQVFGITWQALAALCLTLSLVILAWVDLDTRLLPDFLTLPLLAAGLVVNAGGVFVPWPQALAGAAFGYGILWIVAALYRRWRGQDGLGGGDLKCAAALGGWLGWQALPLLLLLAALVGVVAGALTAVCLRRPLRPQAFGPWLAVSGLVLLFAGSGGMAPPLS